MPFAEQVNADSLVFYMGRDSAPDIARQLIDAGRDGDTAVAIVEACSTPRERTLTLTLARLAAGDAQAWLDAAQPSLLMIGAAFADARPSRFSRNRKTSRFSRCLTSREGRGGWRELSGAVLRAAGSACEPQRLFRWI